MKKETNDTIVGIKNEDYIATKSEITIAVNNTYGKNINPLIVPALLSIAKKCLFIFSNEANYPEGTEGYKIAQDAKEAINKSTIK